MSLAFEEASAATLRAIGSALRAGQLAAPLSPLAIARVAPSCSEAAARELIRLSYEGMLYYDPRSLATNAHERATWHAKVVVIDDERALVTSANFTEWAQQRNVEAGVLIRNAEFAWQLRQQFEGLVRAKAVLEVPGFRS